MEKTIKDGQWFKHDSNAASDPKSITLITYYGYEGYGRWWRIVETLREQAGYKFNIADKFAYPSLAEMLKMNVPEVKKFIGDCIEEFNLLKTDGTYIWSESLIDRMEPLDSKRKKMSERGKEGALARWGKSKEDGDTPDEPATDEKVTKYITFSTKYNKLLNDYKDKYPATEWESYMRFLEWMNKESKRVLKMKEPLTIDQYLKLAREFKTDFDRVKAMLVKMHNYEPLTKRVSVNLTLRNWLNGDNANLTPTQNDENYKEKRKKLEENTKQLELE